MAHQTGIDIKRDLNGALIIPALLLDSSGDPVTSGTTTVYILELQEDGSFETLDFDDDTFKATACTTPTVNASHQGADNATKDTGIWTVVLSDAQQANFTSGNHYIAYFENSGASPTISPRWFQWGGVEGAAATDAELTAAHGASSWQTGTAAPTVQEIDTYLSSVHGAGSWMCVGAGSGVNAVTITLEDGDGNKVGSQLCVVRQTGETSILAFGFTDADGQVAFNLDDGTYKVRWGGYWSTVAGGVGLYSFSNPYDLTVSGTTTSTMECEARSLFTGGLSFAEMRGMLEIFIYNVFEREVATRFSRSLMGQLVNTGYQDLAQKLSWRRDAVSIDIAADDYQYDVTLTSRIWDLVEYYDDSSEAYHILVPLTLAQWRQKMIDAPSASGVPVYYCRYGDEIRLHPTPDDADDTLTIQGIVDVAELTLDDEHPEFPPHLHPLIVDLAMARAWRIAGNAQMGDITEAAADRQIFVERSEDSIRRTSGRIPPPKF